ncbi:MAG: lysophospholipid acyltransferase family protein [Opitutales bacterium]
MVKLLSLNAQSELYRIAQATTRSVVEWLLKGEVAGRHHIPKKGSFLIASNHLSYLDPPAIGCLLERPIYYFARDTLFKPGFADWLLRSLNSIPVKRDADSDVKAMREILKLLKSQGEGLLFFPEGTRSMDGKLQKAKPGIGMIACKTCVPVIPVRLYGTDHAWGKGQKTLNLRTNVSIHIGAPLYPQDYDPNPKEENRYQAASNRIMAAIAALPPVKAPNL